VGGGCEYGHRQQARGYWVDGGPHSIAYVDASGQFLADTVRWSSGALVWATGEKKSYRVVTDRARRWRSQAACTDPDNTRTESGRRM
jgi:hypothetical protein